MKLFYSQNSPYARKCRVVMLEKGLEDRVTLISVNPMENPLELLAVNPLGAVPAMITDDGLHLCDSTAICEYLDTLSPASRLYPTDGARICALAMAVLADGIMDAAVACVLESRRPADKKYEEWVARKEAAILRAIEKFSKIPLDDATLSIGTISLAVALAYVSFRLPHLDWRTAHPALTQWFDTFSLRPSMLATRPQ